MWTVTKHDVFEVLDVNQDRISSSFMELYHLAPNNVWEVAEQVFENLTQRELDSIRDAALSTGDEDEQVVYAQNEIMQILVEKQILNKVRQSSAIATVSVVGQSTTLLEDKIKEVLRLGLEQMALNAASNGVFSGESDVELVNWSCDLQ